MPSPESREYKSYALGEEFSLFDDVEQLDLRVHNRAATMANMDTMSHGKFGSLTPEVQADLSNYFNLIPSTEEKALVLKRLVEQLMYGTLLEKIS